MEFLSEADDLLTLLLLDLNIFGQPVQGGRRTAKMNTKVKELRIPKQELDEVASLVKEIRKGETTPHQSTEVLCKIPCVSKFMTKWESERSLFFTHARKYVQALRPDSGITFHETDRYSKLPKSAKVRQTPSPTPPPPAVGSSRDRPASSIEVAVFASRRFKKGEKIKLKGGVADLSEEQDDALRQSGEKKDFSVLHSARKNCFSLLLGPARFVNHDCRNNVEFVLTGNHMAFVAIEDIEADEQLFTDYGQHYFEENNAACMCSSCEQHGRGAFSKVTKPVKPAKPAPPPRSSISRRTSRGGGSGHELTAQRSLSRSTSRADSSSPGPQSRNPSPSGSSAADQEKRRSERATAPAIDPLRIGKRIVHPRLPPPPGYKKDYEWDNKKKVAKYIGLTVSPFDQIARAKRQRAGSDSDTDTGKPKYREFDFDALFRKKKKKKRPSDKPRKEIKVGGRTSSRNPNAVFSRLSALVGESSDSDLSSMDDDVDAMAEDFSSDLSELPTTDEEDVGMELEVEVESKNDITPPTPDEIPPTPTESAGDARISTRSQAKGSFFPSVISEGDEADLTVLPATDDEAIAVRRRRGESSLIDDSEGATPAPVNPDSSILAPEVRPVATSSYTNVVEASSSGPADASTDDEQYDERDIVLVPSPTANSRTRLRPPRRNARETGAEAVDSGEGVPNGNDLATGPGKAGGPFDGDGQDAGQGPPEPPAGPSQNGNGAGREGRDDEDGEDKKGKGKGRAGDARAEDAEMKDGDLEEEEDESEVQPMAVESLKAQSEAPMSESGEEAVALLLLSLTAGGPVDSSSSNAYGPAPPAFIPSPPKTSSSETSTASFRSFDKTEASTTFNKKRPRASREPAAVVEDVKPDVQRSTRRNSLLHENPKSSPKPSALPSIKDSGRSASSSRKGTDSPKRSGSAPVGASSPSTQDKDKKRGRASGLSNSVSGRPASASPHVPHPRASSHGHESSRNTRRSHPIAGDLKDLMNSPQVMGVAGGYNESLGRYTSSRRVTAPVRSATPDTPPPPPPPAVVTASGGEGRSTRRTQPIEGNLQDLIASPLVAAVSGGFDPETKRYITTKAAKSRLVGAGGAVDREVD
ncbi:hypothetical protein T439DRAFT_206708 [Meredithblackwellia eburnea MCA 4105]